MKIFAFDNHFMDSEMAGDPIAQVALLQRLGYDATYHSTRRGTPEGWATFLAWEEISRGAGLSVAAYYTVLELDNEPPPGGRSVGEMIDHLPPGSVLDLAVSLADTKPSDPANDGAVIAALRPLLEIARQKNIMISLYHHIWFLIERIEDCVRIAKKINDPLLGVTFCGYHWYAVDGTDLAAKARLAAPWMRLANLSGRRPAPENAKHAGCLPKTIEPIGEGDFPLTEYVRALEAAGYAGPVGFQGYKMAGDPAANLSRSIQAWRGAVSGQA